MNRISIIVPMFNAEGTIVRCIESIMSQSYNNLEIILIDDGSQDRTLEICSNYSEIDARIKVFSQNNKGVSAARNVGIKKASGVFLQFVDSDDYIATNMCECLIENTKNNMDLVICGYFNAFNNNIESCKCIDYVAYKIEEMENIFPFLLEKFMLQGPCNKLYRKDKITDMFDCSMDLGEDLIFNIKYLSNVNRISIISRELYTYVHENTNSLTQKFRANGFEISNILYNYLISFNHDMFNDSQEIESSISTLFVNEVLHHIKLFILDNKIPKCTKLKYINTCFNNKNMEKSIEKIKCSKFKYIILQSKKAPNIVYYYFTIKNILDKKRLV